MKRLKKKNLNLNVLLLLSVLLIATYMLFKLTYSERDLTVATNNSDKRFISIDPASGYQKFPLVVKLSNTSPSTIFTSTGETPHINSSFYTGPIHVKRPVQWRLALIPTSPRWYPPLEINERASIFIRTGDLTANGNLTNETSVLYLQEEFKSEFSVVSFTIHEEDLFSQDHGIYVLGKRYESKKYYIEHSLPLDSKWWDYPANYMKRGQNSKRDASIQLITNGKVELEAPVSVMIKGNATRAFAQKSLLVQFKSPLNFALFNDPPESVASFVLRNGGNDWTKTMFRDELMQQLMTPFRLECQRYKPVIVYINGEYWGIHNLRDDISSTFLSEKHHVRKDSITIIDLPSSLKTGNETAMVDFSELMGVVASKGCEKPEIYNKVRQAIDLENLTDFAIANIYFANADWPRNNCRMWRADGDSTNGKWKMILFDTDYGFGFFGEQAITMDMFKQAVIPSQFGTLLSCLLKNDEYRNFFISRFNYHLDNTFKTDRVIKLIDSYHASLKNEMPYHLKRWRTLPSENSWNNEVEMLRKFAKERPAVVRSQLEGYAKSSFKL